MSSTQNAMIVRTEHLVGEMLLVDLGHTTLVSDHPEYMGGQGKGPTPGEFVKGALASSAAIGIGQAIERGGLAVRSFSVACSTGFETERKDEGPLPSVTTLANFQLHIALVGALDEAQVATVEAAARTCDVARLLAGGIDIEERNVFRPEAASRPARATTHLIDQMHERRPRAGEKVVQPVNRQTGVRANYLGDGRSLLQWARTTYVARQGHADLGYADGASPELLLLAGLSACTSVFVSRAAAVTKADAEVRVITTGGSDPTSGEFRISKTLEVIGELSDSQKDTMEFFGDNCAIGETLRRKAQISVFVEQVASTASDLSAGLSVAPSDAQILAGRLDEVVCDDGSCCVPDVDALAKAKGR